MRSAGSCGRLQDELWPFPRPGSGLVETLKQRTAWLLATPLAVAVGEGVAGLPEADIQAVADVAELILAGLGNAEAWDRPIVYGTSRPGPDLPRAEHDAGAGARPGLRRTRRRSEASLHRLAAAIQARADVGLDDRRLRIWMEIPRCPQHRAGARAGA